MLEPLPLHSPRWTSLKAHFGNAGLDTEIAAVPKLLQRWHRAVGGYAEEYAYADLYESFLHQLTILDVAYAVVPHLVTRLGELDPDRRIHVLDDVAIVEQTRLRDPADLEATIEAMRRTLPEDMRDICIQATRSYHPALPDDLAVAYLEAVVDAKRVAGDAWGRAVPEQRGPHEFRRHVRHLRDAGLGDADVIFGVDALTRDDEESEGALVYLGAENALDGLRRLTDGPPGWFDRTEVRSETERGWLIFRALHSLAWVHQRFDVRTMLRDAR
jgi:hypothetical protein